MRVEPSDLKQYLPNYYDGILETDVLMDVENTLFDIVKKNMQDVLNNQFVLTCDVQMLYRYEQMLNIRPDTVLETVEFRRMRVLNRLNSRQPFTYWFYRQALDTLFGRDNSVLVVDHNSHLLNIDISTWDMPAYNEFINHLRITKPASLALNLKLTNELPKINVNHASATISGEAIDISPYLITDIKSSGLYHHGLATVSGESVNMTPQIITNVQVSGVAYYTSTIVSGESIIVYPIIVTDINVSGKSLKSATTTSGEFVSLNPETITQVTVNGTLNKNSLFVSGEEIEIYPKGE